MPTPAINLSTELERFRHKLLDLSLKNPLLNYRISKRRTLEIVDEIPDEVYRRLVVQEKSMQVVPDPTADLLVRGALATEEAVTSDDSTKIAATVASANDPLFRNDRANKKYFDNQLQSNVGPIKFQTIARGIARDARTTIEETGINYLHLALGFLKWRESDLGDAEMRMAPLLLIPVEMKAKLSDAGGYEFQITWNEDDVQSNASLRKKLESEFGVALPEIQEEQTPSDYFESVARSVQRKPNWRVEPSILLGFFSFHKLSMFVDIDPANWAESTALSESSIASRLVMGTLDSLGSGLYAQDYDVDEHPVAKAIELPLDADSSQQSAISDIAEGKSLVIEGPPGTGKSQTIANAIANAIERGKTVLFVAEKLAALEVVYKRLAQAGLSDFCLELHGHAVAPKKVMESLASRLGAHKGGANTEMDSKRRLEQCKDKLRAYMVASSKLVGPHREPLYDLFWRIVRLRQKGITLVRNIACDTEIELSAYEEACEALGAFANHSQQYENPVQSAWWGYFPRDLAPTEAERVLDQIEKLYVPATEIQKQIQAISGYFNNDKDRISAFLRGVDGAKFKALLDNVPLRSPLKFRLLADKSLQQTIRRVEAAHRVCVESKVKLDQNLVESAQEPSEIAKILDRDTVQQLRKLPGELQGWQFKELQSWLDQTLMLAATLQKQVAAWQPFGIGEILSVDDYDRATQVVHLLQHSAIDDVSELGIEWFLESARKSLSQSKARCEDLRKRRDEIASVFHLPSTPERERLLFLTGRFRSNGASWFCWLSGDYRLAVKEIRQFATFPKGFGFAKKLKALESLESFDKDLKAYLNDPTSMKLLRSQFRGLESDWDRISQTLNWVLTAKKLGLDFQRVNRLLPFRQELSGPLGIHNIKAELQQFREQFNSENAKALGFAQIAISTSRIQNLSDRLSNLRKQLASLEQYSKLFLAGSSTKLKTMLDVHESGTQFSEARTSLDLVLNTGDEVARTLVDSIVNRGIGLGEAVQWLQDFESTSMDEQLIDALDAFGVDQVCYALVQAQCSISESMERWNFLRNGVVGNADVRPSWLASSVDGAPRFDLLSILEQIKSERERLPAWLALCRTYDRCRRFGVDAFAMAAARDEIEESQLSDCFQLALLNQVAERELMSNSIGFNFTSAEMEDIRGNFQRFDRASMKAKSIEIDRNARERYVPEGNNRGRVSELTELSLIRHELGKKSRHCRIRDLMVRAGNATQVLKPCFLMSPLSLARYIPSDSMNFDMVIMDEASQIKPEDAIGAILRAKQLIVVGDPKQLPPSSFFDQTDEELEDDEATQFDNAESILEVAQRSFQPYRRLRWHYRSQHETLIQFSNGKFYDDDLVVFPSPKDSMGGFGVLHHFVPGATCVKGQNVKEAEAIVHRIVQHAQMCPSESLGVAAFNQKQAELIDALLQKACDQDTGLARLVSDLREGDEGLFIKNLENIQGDERDVIFISYTYGADPNTGHVFQRFGPINSEMGWRRLNVMVTRSRRRMEVFTSMRPGDIQCGPDKSRGVNAYHDFLEFAQSGMMREVGSESGREPDSPFEESVARVVDACGLEPVFQVGVVGYFIDIGVRRREGNREFLLGIECDGATYHSSRSARDRDRLREEIIKARGWRLHRIWSTEWFLNQKSEEARLEKALNEVSANG